MGAVAVTGIASAAAGIRFAGTAPDGAVPMKTGDRPAKRTPPAAVKLKRVVNTLGSLHLASAVALTGVNAALSQASFRRPPARRAARSAAGSLIRRAPQRGSRLRRRY